MEHIKSLLAESKLTNKEQAELLELLKLLPQTDLKEIISFLKGHPDWVFKLYHNYRAKVKAVRTADTKLWQEILEEEGKIVKEIK